jgi:hypothetical protein
MDLQKSFKDILAKTSVLRVPKHTIATFGHTRIKYFFVSETAGFSDRSRLREGLVLAESPKIITPDMLKNRFEGFGDDSESFGRWLSERYGASFLGLQYKFRNEPHSSKIEYQPLAELAEHVQKVLSDEGSQQSAVIRGPDDAWQVSLMKFIVDECLRSFSDNYRELDEHGYFNPSADREEIQKEEIENLFGIAAQDSAMIPILGNKLKQFGVFKEYEDRFFRLIGK